MRVLVVGYGAREHTLVWKIARSLVVEKIFCAPGNAGTGLLAENVPIAAEDIARLADWAEANRIDLTVAGPEAPLVAGIADLFTMRGFAMFGPAKAAAQIEGSKAWAKEIMFRHGIPTARSATFDSYDAAKAYLQTQSAPIVVKADGLAAGKGVFVCASREEALAALEQTMVQRVFGGAGERVVIEEYMEGPEVSVLALTDGNTVVPVAPACDYKRVRDNDEGPNTGGMGAYSPPRFVSDDVLRQITETVLKPTVRGLAQEGTPYKGVLYAGIMVTKEGPKVLEFNCRFGDPEVQVILPRLESDLVPLMQAVVNGTLDRETVKWSSDVACGVVLASGGYKTGFPISGLDTVDADALVFHAGTKKSGDQIVTAGGRVLTVVATGSDMAEAREKVYRNVERISFDGCHYRKDIALREVLLSASRPLVGIVMGSQSDAEYMQKTVEALNSLGIENELVVLSAHRTPEATSRYAQSARSRGVEVLIAGAGGSAHLPGVLASWTTLPVIGVPLPTSEMRGVDALHAIVQMPAGVPVAAMAIGSAGARNAAYLAAQILAIKYPAIREAYDAFRQAQSQPK